MKIGIRRFKSIETATLDLNKVNVLVGGNNAGKSSVIQAIQFAVSCAQTVKVKSKSKFKKGKLGATITPDELFYSPIKNVSALGYNNKSLQTVAENAIEVRISDEGREATTVIRKGKNVNLSISINGEEIGEELCSLEKPYSMYVPGLAGIPFEEQYVAFGAVRRSAARGDSNHVFRNILYHLHNKEGQWNSFMYTLSSVFSGIKISVECEMDNTSIVEVKVSLDGGATYLPIDAMGTGILQAIQICAYIYLFQPHLLLLDEPDAHLHPNNQIALANILIELTESVSSRIILTTHSRTLISALKDTAKFFRVFDGCLAEDFDHYSTLLDLGALDDIDRLQSGQYKWIVLTEDTKNPTKNPLHLVLEASGLLKNDYKCYPYQGTSNISAAKMVAEFVCGLNPNIKVLIHIDRDGRTEKEIAEEIDKISSSNGRIQGFLTKYNDIESYFCGKEHITYLLLANGQNANDSEISELIEEAMEEVKDCSQRKMITNRGKIRKTHNDQGIVAMDALKDYESNPRDYVYGKKLRGILANKLHSKFGLKDLFSASDFIKDDVLYDIFTDKS